MLPLETDAVPATAADWRDALTRALSHWIAGPVRAGVDGEPPALQAIDIDLSGGWLNEGPPPDLAVVGPADPGPTVDRFRAVARPVVVRRVPVSLDLSADHARFALGRNAAGRIIAMLANAANGRLSVHIAAPDLDAALLIAARDGAPAGVDVRSVHATLASRGPRELDVALDVTAKKFMTFTMRVTGHLSVDNTLTATATNLNVEGSGMAAGIASSLVRPQLAKLEGQRLPLLAFNLGDVRLRDVAVDVTNGLAVTATFGGSGGAVA